MSIPAVRASQGLARLREWVERHPRLAAWVGLAVAMVAMLVLASGGAGLLPGQLLALVVSTVVLAGACVWIIFWE
ncbi:MAG: hypothetical protein ACE5NC_01215 [Anaerolineae bacterium]